MTFACPDRTASAYETGRLSPGDLRLFRPGGLQLTARAVTLADIAPGTRVVDLGCGAGDTVSFLRDLGIDAIGIDTESDTSDHSPDFRIQANADALPFADASIDAIFAECSFSLMPDRDRVLAECARVLVEGGALVLSDLYARRSEAIAEVRALHSTCASGMLLRDELEDSLARAGFSVELWEDHSRALRECAARFLFEHGSLDGLWACSGDASPAIQAALRAARAGYFLLIARRSPTQKKGDASDE